MGRTFKNKERIEGKIILFGNCAKNIYYGDLIPGCPPINNYNFEDKVKNSVRI